MNGLQKAANIAIILAAIVVSGAVLYGTFVPKQTASGATNLTPQLMGKRLQLGTENAGERATAILFVKPGCQYCAASMPFYQRLQALSSAAPGDLKIVGAVGTSGGDGEGLKDYLGRYGVTPDRIESIDFGALGIRAVPTLVLIDNTNHVTGVWTGLLPPEKEKAVLATLKLTCGKCAG